MCVGLLPPRPALVETKAGVCVSTVSIVCATDFLFFDPSKVGSGPNTGNTDGADGADAGTCAHPDHSRSCATFPGTMSRRVKCILKAFTLTLVPIRLRKYARFTRKIISENGAQTQPAVPWL